MIDVDLRSSRRGFSLIELLVSLGIVSLLVSILLPSLRGVRDTARGTACLSNQRQLGTAWFMYAAEYRDRAMPLAYWSTADIGAGQSVYWWGTHGTSTTPVDHARGFIAPYLTSALAARSVYECPSQPWGTYRAQGPSQPPQPTSTYGYNGYYLSPAKTPGWGSTIGHRPWRRLADIQRPSSLFVFADAMLPATPPRNCALLDPPQLWSGTDWVPNDSPTTSFRHDRGTAMAVSADGSARPWRAASGDLVDETNRIGSVGGLAPHYVPDATDWR
jgi:prepilin-type N-terminal cleavage/methylation domain-containing protein